MRGRPVILQTEDEAIHYYVGVYYQEVQEMPAIRLDIDQHIDLINGVNDRYLLALKRNKAFNYELYEGRFIECIEFITRAFSKRDESDRKKRERREATEGYFK